MHAASWTAAPASRPRSATWQSPFVGRSEKLRGPQRQAPPPADAIRSITVTAVADGPSAAPRVRAPPPASAPAGDAPLPPPPRPATEEAEAIREFEAWLFENEEALGTAERRLRAATRAPIAPPARRARSASAHGRGDAFAELEAAAGELDGGVDEPLRGTLRPRAAAAEVASILS